MVKNLWPANIIKKLLQKNKKMEINFCYLKEAVSKIETKCFGILFGSNLLHAFQNLHLGIIHKYRLVFILVIFSVFFGVDFSKHFFVYKNIFLSTEKPFFCLQNAFFCLQKPFFSLQTFFLFTGFWSIFFFVNSVDNF